MSDNLHPNIVPAIRRLASAAGGQEASDGELLSRWLHRRDEAAFELIVWRHAALVLGVCRQVLRDPHDVEDAFQASFLVLLRKASSIARGDSLPAWLHQVAFRVALRARQREAPSAVSVSDDMAAPDVMSPDRDLCRVVHEEVLRLPAKYRLPVVSCYLEGRTHAEAAAELGWPTGTVAGRLARARDLLRRRLSRRGIESDAALASVTLAAPGWAHQVGTLLPRLSGLATTPTAAAGLSGSAAALAEGVINEMFVSKLRWAAVAVVSLGLIGLMSALAAQWPTPVKVMQKEDAAPKNEAGPKKDDDPMQEALDRARVRRQLGRIAGALQRYHDHCGHFPPPAILDSKGKPTLSWRVAILPFLVEGDVFKQFKLEEPWDSEHNKKLLARIPDPFLAVSKTGKTGQTYFQYIVGPSAVFASHDMGNAAEGLFGGGGLTGGMPGGPGMPGGGDGGLSGLGGGFPAFPGGGFGVKGGKGGKGVGRARGMPNLRSTFADGDQNTLLVVEAGAPIEWTKPDDVAFDPKKAPPRLGGQFRDHAHVLTAQLAVVSLPRRLDAKVLRAAITPAGGEDVPLHRHTGAPGNEIRIREIERLQKRNTQMKEDAAILADTVRELKDEVEGLRWRVEREKILKSDPDAAKLQEQNDKMEQQMREAREDLKAMIAEIARLKQALNK